MSEKEFINNLSSVQADIRKLDTKKIFLDNKDILDHIKESVPTIKHSQDTRETIYENDLWGQWVETKDDGTIVVHDDWVTNPNSSSNSAWLSYITKVEDNKAYNGDTVFANIQTEMIKNGRYMFSGAPLTSFSGDLSNLVYGLRMFYDTSLTSFSSDMDSLVNSNFMFRSTPLTSFRGDLSSLVNGSNMFDNTPLTSFSGDLSNLVFGSSMFRSTSLTSFNGVLSKLVNGVDMFSDTSLASFSSDLSNLVDGDGMFYNTPLTSFSGVLSSLVNGSGMFYKCKLSPQSIMYIVESIRNITEEKAKYTNGEIPWVTYDSTTRKYSAPFGFMENGKYVYTYNYDKLYNNTGLTTATISASDVGTLTLGIDVTNNADTISDQLQTFAEECLYESWAKLKEAFSNKGWTVTFQYGGSDSSIALSEDEQFRGVPVYARLIEVSEEDKDKAEYCTEDGTKFYNIAWGHDVTDYDSYQYFGSLLEACGYFGVIPVKYLEEN